jgi:23S rRNA (uridine2552-2'-O)-methyltransferase
VCAYFSDARGRWAPIGPCRRLVYICCLADYTRKDATYRAAKAAGYRSRAAPKLLELDKRYKIFRRGMRVLDLGCWPGGWLQVAGERVGPGGRVVGVDLVETDAVGAQQVVAIMGDAKDPAVQSGLLESLGGPANLVLSDMAPKLSGIKVADRERHLALVELAIDVAQTMLAADGSVVIKLFSGVESESTVLLKKAFGRVTKMRPAATRKGSEEIYAFASRMR